ncbi:hypothetical protein Dsin_021679 [Dipteronia sinensis]|uniref:DUF659 domain-containing protein n=1 Tax=Dipteronia sinensis TaxID=43782 RepID=A0AAE0DZB7_9ROSI|nr:hypothetical protein Dsin_021679 [Dipteronia sinensis]
MTEAWTDRKMRSIMNSCVNFKEGTTFLSSKDSSAEAYTGENIFKYVLSAIEEVGPENVVQVVTDNASNNMAATKMLKVKMPSIFWSSCATHTINLMLEGIGKLPKFKNTLEEAKSFIIFIYAHHTTFALIRTFTRKRDIVRSGVTRFASAFLTLQSLLEKKDKLRPLFTSTDWEKCKWLKSVKGKAAYNTVLSIMFWNGMEYCLRVFSPLVRVLRLVDGDRKPSMGFLYVELKKAKEEIREELKNVECNYRPIFEIIDEKSKGRLDSPLHFVAYVLNPYYFFSGSTSSIYTNEVSNGFCTFAEILYPDDLENQNLFVNIEFGKYLNKEGPFRRPLALKGCEKNDEFYNPVVPGLGLDDSEVRDLEDDFQSDNDAVEENVEFESDDDVVFQLDEYVVEDEALETLS